MTDRVYVSTAALHVLEFELGPGGGFRHSPSNKTVFAADVFYQVLAGTLVIADPEHGEVRVVEVGEGVLFRRDTWHHGFNPSTETAASAGVLRPAAEQGHGVDLLRNQPDLASMRYHDTRWERRWPMAATERERDASKLHVVQRERGAVGVRRTAAPSHLQGTLVDTEHLLVRTGGFAAGHVEDLHEDGGRDRARRHQRPALGRHPGPCTGDFAAACLEPG